MNQQRTKKLNEAIMREFKLLKFTSFFLFFLNLTNQRKIIDLKK